MKSSTLSPEEIDKEILKELGQELAPTLPPDEDVLFGQSVGANLKMMTPQQNTLAKMCIQQVMTVAAIWREKKVDPCYLETKKFSSQLFGARKKIMIAI